MILNHKKQKLVYRNCGIMQRDIKDVIRHLKERKI